MTVGLFARMADLTERICGTESLRPKPSGEWSFGEYVARVLCDDVDVQHVAPLIYGLPGVGKSTTAYKIAISTSSNMAQILGKEPVDIFSPEEDIWIADDQDEFVRTLSKSYRHVFILDESGIVEDARDGMKTENKMRTKAAAIARDRRCCIIRCCQMKDMVDKRIRGLSTHEIQIVEDHHNMGYNVVKIKKLYLADINKEPYKMYLTPNGIDRIVRHIIYAPEEEEYNLYKKRRMETVEGYLGKDRNVKPASEQKAKKDAQCAEAWLYYMDMSHPYVSLNKAATSKGIDVKTLQRWMADPDRGREVKGAPVVLASQRPEDEPSDGAEECVARDR